MIFIRKNSTDVYTRFNFPLKAKRSLDYTNTKKEDWKLANLKAKTRQELNQMGISFTGYSNFPESTPFTDSLIEPLYSYKKQNNVVEAYAKIDGTGKIISSTNIIRKYAKTNCEFCGKQIKDFHIIISEKKKIHLKIGSECRKQFTDAEDPLDQINKNMIISLKKLLLEKGWQNKMINRIKQRRDYCKNSHQNGKFHPGKLYADFERLFLKIAKIETPQQNNMLGLNDFFSNNEIKFSSVNLNNCTDDEILEIWKLARKAFTVKDPSFLDEISDYLKKQRWD